jgi:hypothetical protein
VKRNSLLALDTRIMAASLAQLIITPTLTGSTKMPRFGLTLIAVSHGRLGLPVNYAVTQNTSLIQQMCGLPIGRGKFIR